MVTCTEDSPWCAVPTPGAGINRCQPRVSTAIPAAIVERDLTGLEYPIFRKRQGKMQWGTVTQKFSSPLMFFWTKGVEICMLSLDETKTIPATAPNRAREVAQCHGAQAFERRCPDQVGADLF